MEKLPLAVRVGPRQKYIPELLDISGQWSSGTTEKRKNLEIGRCSQMKAKYTPVVVQNNPLTLTDYPGQLAWMIAIPGCNYRCPTCHNMDIALDNNVKKWPLEDEVASIPAVIKHVVLGGGEPLAHRNIIKIVKYLHKKGYKIALQTNGYEFRKLWMVRKHVDYVAMDVKWPYEKINYRAALVRRNGQALYGVAERTALSILTITSNWTPDKYEFRTTVVPGMTNDDLLSIASWLLSFRAQSYYIQKYNGPDALAVTKEAAEALLAKFPFTRKGTRW